MENRAIRQGLYFNSPIFQFQVWFQNRRAKLRRQLKMQSKSSSGSNNSKSEVEKGSKCEQGEDEVKSKSEQTSNPGEILKEDCQTDKTDPSENGKAQEDKTSHEKRKKKKSKKKSDACEDESMNDDFVNQEKDHIEHQGGTQNQMYDPIPKAESVENSVPQFFADQEGGPASREKVYENPGESRDPYNAEMMYSGWMSSSNKILNPLTNSGNPRERNSTSSSGHPSPTGPLMSPHPNPHHAGVQRPQDLSLLSGSEGSVTDMYQDTGAYTGFRPDYSPVHRAHPTTPHTFSQTSPSGQSLMMSSYASNPVHARPQDYSANNTSNIENTTYPASSAATIRAKSKSHKLNPYAAGSVGYHGAPSQVSPSTTAVAMVAAYMNHGGNAHYTHPDPYNPPTAAHHYQNRFYGHEVNQHAHTAHAHHGFHSELTNGSYVTNGVHL